MYHSIKYDLFEYVKTSTPIKEDMQCNVCIKAIPIGNKISKCEECDKMVCEDCAKKTYVKEDPDNFMCVRCQWYI